MPTRIGHYLKRLQTVQGKIRKWPDYIQSSRNITSERSHNGQLIHYYVIPFISNGCFHRKNVQKHSLSLKHYRYWNNFYVLFFQFCVSFYYYFIKSMVQQQLSTKFHAVQFFDFFLFPFFILMLCHHCQIIKQIMNNVCGRRLFLICYQFRLNVCKISTFCCKRSYSFDCFGDVAAIILLYALLCCFK